jgi:hypothetical protein
MAEKFLEGSNLDSLDSRSLLKACRDRFRGNDGALFIATQAARGEGVSCPKRSI